MRRELHCDLFPILLDWGACELLDHIKSLHQARNDQVTHGMRSSRGRLRIDFLQFQLTESLKSFARRVCINFEDSLSRVEAEPMHMLTQPPFTLGSILRATLFPHSHIDLFQRLDSILQVSLPPLNKVVPSEMSLLYSMDIPATVYVDVLELTFGFPYIVACFVFWAHPLGPVLRKVFPGPFCLQTIHSPCVKPVQPAKVVDQWLEGLARR